jgi:hypothetical protein
MTKFLLSALACAALSAPIAVEAAMTAPLRVESCDVSYFTQGQPINGSPQSFTNGVTITVRNVSSEPIASFSGGGKYAGSVITGSTAHQIAPGATYSFYKRYHAFPFDGTKAECFVSKVTFVDGSSWVTP